MQELYKVQMETLNNAVENEISFFFHSNCLSLKYFYYNIQNFTGGKIRLLHTKIYVCMQRKSKIVQLLRSNIFKQGNMNLSKSEN